MFFEISQAFGLCFIAKLVNGQLYSIISDYLGTPIQAFDSSGELVWERELNIYGSLRKGDNDFVPFLCFVERAMMKNKTEAA